MIIQYLRNEFETLMKCAKLSNFTTIDKFVEQGIIESILVFDVIKSSLNKTSRSMISNFLLFYS